MILLEANAFLQDTFYNQWHRRLNMAAEHELQIRLLWTHNMDAHEFGVATVPQIIAHGWCLVGVSLLRTRKTKSITSLNA